MLAAGMALWGREHAGSQHGFGYYRLVYTSSYWYCMCVPMLVYHMILCIYTYTLAWLHDCMCRPSHM